VAGKTHQALVTEQFGPRADAYLTSAVHAEGEDLTAIAAMVRGHPRARVLDLGSGAGHVSFAVAPHVAEVIAFDLSAAMLAVVLPMAGAALAPDVHALIVWRFIQGLLLPPIFAVTVAYIGDEWSPADVPGVAGIYIAGKPTVGRAYSQEYYKGHAQDHYAATSLNASIQVPYVSSHRALLTREWTPLEPGAIDHKYYVRGIGTVKEVTVKGPLERADLVSVRRR